MEKIIHRYARRVVRWFTTPSDEEIAARKAAEMHDYLIHKARVAIRSPECRLSLSADLARKVLGVLDDPAAQANQPREAVDVARRKLQAIADGADPVSLRHRGRVVLMDEVHKVASSPMG